MGVYILHHNVFPHGMYVHLPEILFSLALLIVFVLGLYASIRDRRRRHHRHHKHESLRFGWVVNAPVLKEEAHNVNHQ